MISSSCIYPLHLDDRKQLACHNGKFNHTIILMFFPGYGTYMTLYMYIYMSAGGVSSESRFDWLVRLYFLSFNIVTLVIFEVAIASLVEAFIYKVLARQRHRICRKHKEPFKHCQCPEGELFTVQDKHKQE